MKKLIMIFVAAATVSVASAQKVYRSATSDKNSSVYAVNEGQSPHYITAGYNAYEFSAKEKEAKIRQINQAYEAKMRAVKTNRHLRPSEKQKQISWLKNQRAEQIKQANDHFYSSTHGHYDNHHDKKW